MKTVEVIAGIEGNRAPVLAAARELNLPVMVSANSLWLQSGRFSRSWKALQGLRVHLDSGGFVAMKRYGGFRFSVADYIQLAADMRPAWFAQMDECCEPEIAADRAEVFRRIDRTAANLRECQEHARSLGAAAPLIVLQGWKPADYASGPAFDDPRFQWPGLVGVGSVCRRHLHGADGLLSVIAKLDAKLPGHVRFHLFGVKSQAVQALRWHPRIASTDSMAWSVTARRAAHKAGTSCNGEARAAALREWVAKQRTQAGPNTEEPELF